MLQSAPLTKCLPFTGIIFLFTMISCATMDQFNHSDYLDPYGEEFNPEMKNFSKAKMRGPINFSTPSRNDDGRRGVSGTLKLLLFVDETGLVRHVDIIRRVDPRIDDAVLQQVQGKRIEPAYLDGDPVKSILEYSFNFQSRIREFRGTR